MSAAYSPDQRIPRRAALSFAAPAAALDLQQVSRAVERVTVGARPGRPDAADGQVAGELRLEHALAAGERRQPLLQVMHPATRDLARQDAGIAADLRCPR